MSNTSNDQVAILWLRDGAGNHYVLTEQQIRSAQATPEQQAAIQKEIGDQDVAGYVGGFAPVGSINIVVAPQINNQVGFNIAAGNFAPVTQSLGQGAGNVLNANQGTRPV